MVSKGIPGSSLPFKQCMEMMRISNLTGGLQLLLVQENDFTEDCGELSRDILWLRWFHCKHRYIPSWLSPENIRVLELQEARSLETLWDDAHPPLQLRELQIMVADMLRSLPRSIGHLKHLKRLSLGCSYEGSKLSRLPEEFCRLRSLEHLALEYCSKLSTLPSRCGDLVNLRHINLRGSQSLERLPESFKELIHLEYLNLSDCVELTLESNILENISNIRVFDVSGCCKLQVLPDNITNQVSLRKLVLRYTNSLRELPSTIGQLRKLENLEIVGSPLLTSLPTDFRQLSNLRNLRIQNCSLRELEFEPGLGLLSSLRELYLWKTSVSRISLPQDCCPSLETLCVEICPSLLEIETLPTALKFIKLRECPMLARLGLPGAIEKLTNLKTLEIGKCSIRELHFRRGSSASLCGLREIYLWDTSVSRISLHQDCCPSLENLRLEICPSLTEIETLPTALKFIQFRECTMLGRLGLPGLIEQLTNLETLEIGRSSISELPFGRGSSTALRQLRKILVQDTSVSRISLPQDCCPSLETLRLEFCPSLIEIETLPTSLKLIELIGCTMLVSLGLPGEFEVLTNLQTLKIRQCSIRELPFGRGSSSSSLCNLRSIQLEANHLSTLSISPESCKSLHELTIENEEYLVAIETLPAALKKISLVNCKMLKTIRGIHAVVNVQKLNILICPEISEMPTLARLVSLNILDVEDCHKIKKIEGLEHLKSLEKLVVWTCWMEPGIHSLGGMERLRALNLRAANISAFETCIHSIQIENWPWEMTISAKIFPRVQSILDSFTFPGLAVVKNSTVTDDHNREYTEWSITSWETNLSNAALVYFVVNSYEEGSCLGVNEGQSTRVELSKGEWLVISVFREVSQLIKDGGRSVQASIDQWVGLPFQVLGGRLIVGEKGVVIEGFKQLLQTLSKRD
ncbi:uncharacterized protein LOC131037569 [Cryptomeria japonica]|uniref:uncharacterized protein LOC131037569 n=1 Tax=Cryptomeria japonica TaxID=3369 RepID=UPI0025AC7F44|nr:uncharacterized protein LOC131037569 [Cryptomeria japonica]